MTTSRVKGELVARRNRADHRRRVLMDAGCSTYELVYTNSVREDHVAILCVCCGHASANPNDVEHKWCGFCRTGHNEDGQVGAR